MKIWKDVVGYEGIYQVSNDGDIKRIGEYSNQTGKTWKSNKILKPATKLNGYKYVQLSKNGKTKPKHIHRIVAEAFILNYDEKATVNHKDGNKSNNCVDNLEWNTYSENNQHAYDSLGKASRKNRGGKPVLQYDLDGNFIKEYPSYREALRQTGIHSIYVACKGAKQQTAGGFIWKYKEDI